MKVGLFFGSFNPLHKGHISIAKFMVTKTDLDQVWLIVSPHNPFKNKKILGDAEKRFLVAKKAIGRSRKIKVSDIELKLSQPSYTINTLKLLKKKFPSIKFSLIMGLDSLATFHKWKDYKTIMRDFQIYVYPRAGANGGGLINNHHIKVVDAPMLNISSTFIRRWKKKGKSVKKFLP